MKLEQRKSAVFALLAILMTIIFNDPILSAANEARLINGVPVLYIYLFGSWALCILSLFIHAQMRTKKKK